MKCKRNTLKVTLMMIIIFYTSIFAQSLPTKNNIPDGWQRWMEVGGFAAMVFTAGCGEDLLKRRNGDTVVSKYYQDAGISMNQHRNAHRTGSVIASSLYLASAWQLYKTNLQRDHLEFRHKAHNTLFLTTVGGIVLAGIVGVLSSNAYRDSHTQQARKYAMLMKQISYSTLTIGFADIVLFGRHDNASIIGVKINF